MFLLAFYAFLRIGEMTFSLSSPDNILKISDVKIRCQTVEISLRNYNHSHGQGPKRLILKKQSDKSLCPVTSLNNYLSYRGHLAGHLFITQLGKPLIRAYFSVIFKSCLRATTTSVKADEYNTHSFRVGAASWAAMKGMAESQRNGTMAVKCL